MKEKIVSFKGKEYELHLYSRKEWNDYMKDCNPKGSKFWWFWMFFPKFAKKRKIPVEYPCWIARRVAAVAIIYTYHRDSSYIDMRNSVWFKKHHIRHELGHILGYPHTWKPNLMNPTRLLRWFPCFPRALRGEIEVRDAP